MTLKHEQNTLYLSAQVTVEDAEILLGLVLEQPSAALDLAQLEYLHTAPLQVLMAAGLNVLAWPLDESLKSWLQAALAPEGKV